MSDEEVEITGLDQLQDRLERLGGDEAREIVKEGLSEGGDALREVMRISCADAFTGEPRQVAAQQSSWSKSARMESDLSGTVRVGPKGSLVDLHVSRGHGRQPLNKIYRRSLRYLIKLAEFGSSGGKERGDIRRSTPMTSGFESYKNAVLEKVIEVIQKRLGLDDPVDLG